MDFLQLDHPAEGVARITIHRPEVRNALNQAVREQLGEMRRKVEENCDYVGDRFADEARKIHYGETEARGIYGEASDDQHRELVEEGIETTRIPWLPRDDA